MADVSLSQSEAMDNTRSPTRSPSGQSGLAQLVTGQNANALPSRERVSAAIALVRSRQGNVTKASDAAELKHFKSRSFGSKPVHPYNSSESASSMNSALTSVPSNSKSKAASGGIQVSTTGSSSNNVHSHGPRSPLAEQQVQAIALSPVKKQISFFQNIFASRSDAKGSSATSNTALPNGPSMSDEGDFEDKAAENSVPTSSSSRGSNSNNVSVTTSQTSKSESVKGALLSHSLKQQQVALEESRFASSGPDSADALSPAQHDSAPHPFMSESPIPTAPSMGDDSDSDSDSDSDLHAVDPKTITDVSQFLDALKLKPSAPEDGSREAPIELEEGSKEAPIELDDIVELDDIEALRQMSTEGDEFSDSQSEVSSDDSSAASEVNQETLTEIGAFIDAVQMVPNFDKKEDAPTFADSSVSVPATKNYVSAVVQQDDDMEDDLGLYASCSSDSDIIAQTRTSKPSPIYERMEPVPLGAGRDPPSVRTADDGPKKADPPAPSDLSEAVMHMHQAQVAPSYSVESLESSGPAMNLVEDGKKDPNGKTEEDTLEVEILKITPEESAVEREPVTEGGVVTKSDSVEEDEHHNYDSDEEMRYMAEMGRSLSPVMEAPSTDSDAQSQISYVSAAPSDESEALSQISDAKLYESEDAEAIEDAEKAAADVVPSSSTESDAEIQYEEAVVQAISDDIEEKPNYDELLLEALGTNAVLSPRVARHSQADEEGIHPETSHSPTDEADDPEPPSEKHMAEVYSKKQPVEAENVDLCDEQTFDKVQLSSASSDSDACEGTIERYATLESSSSSKDESEVDKKLSQSNEPNIKDLPSSPSMKSIGEESAPWELKDIASEETTKAAGRTRPRVTHPASRNKARMLTSLLSDDSSVPQSIVSTALDRIESNEQEEENNKISSEAKLGLNLNDVVVYEEGEGVELLESSLLQRQNMEEAMSQKTAQDDRYAAPDEVQATDEYVAASLAPEISQKPVQDDSIEAPAPIEPAVEISNDSVAASCIPAAPSGVACDDDNYDDDKYNDDINDDDINDGDTNDVDISDDDNNDDDSNGDDINNNKYPEQDRSEGEKEYAEKHAVDPTGHVGRTVSDKPKLDPDANWCIATQSVEMDVDDLGSPLSARSKRPTFAGSADSEEDFVVNAESTDGEEDLFANAEPADGEEGFIADAESADDQVHLVETQKESADGEDDFLANTESDDDQIDLDTTTEESTDGEDDFLATAESADDQIGVVASTEESTDGEDDFLATAESADDQIDVVASTKESTDGEDDFLATAESTDDHIDPVATTEEPTDGEDDLVADFLKLMSIDSEKSEGIMAQNTEEVMAQSAEEIMAQNTEEVIAQSTEEIMSQSTEELVARCHQGIRTQSTEEFMAQSTEEIIAQSTEEIEVSYSQQYSGIGKVHSSGSGLETEWNESGAEAEEGDGGFLEQFAALEVEEEGSTASSQKELFIDTKAGPINESKAAQTSKTPSSPKTPNDLFSPSAIARFFARLEEDEEDEELAQKVRHFKKLIAPAVSGEKPSIIESAQIRQAARRAKVPLDVVDNFLDIVDGENPGLPQALSSRDDAGDHTNWDDIEDLDEDEAISAFLTRFGALKSGGHYVDGNLDAIAEFAPQERSSGSGEENVEVDAVFGYVNRELAPTEDEEEEWWKGAVPQRKKAAGGKGHKKKSSFDSDYEWDESSGNVSEGISVGDFNKAPVSPSVVGRTKVKETFDAEQLFINTRPTTSFGYDSDEEKEAWLRRRAMASYGKGWEQHKQWLSPKSSRVNKPQPIDGVAAAENLGSFVFSKRLFPGAKPWKKPYKERTKNHPGYFDVDVYSIYESTVGEFGATDELDLTPWEHRDMKQLFLQERSIGFSRNWFGFLARARGNPKYKPPFCKPKSMEMPIENIPDPGEWTAEWYTTWKSPFQKRRMMNASKSSIGSSDDESETENGSYSDGSTNQKSTASRSSYSGSSVEDDASDTSSWEEAPECGQIINVKQKIGERVSRVHPDYTSSLRRSRWRKKYFPRGTFPY